MAKVIETLWVAQRKFPRYIAICQDEDHCNAVVDLQGQGWDGFRIERRRQGWFRSRWQIVSYRYAGQWWEHLEGVNVEVLNELRLRGEIDDSQTEDQAY